MKGPLSSKTNIGKKKLICTIKTFKNKGISEKQIFVKCRVPLTMIMSHVETIEPHLRRLRTGTTPPALKT